MKEFVVVNVELMDPSNQAYACQWHYEALEDVQSSTAVGHFNTHLFGRSATWGIFCYNTLDFSYVGGEPTFTDSLNRAFWGREMIRKRFSQHVTEDWLENAGLC